MRLDSGLAYQNETFSRNPISQPSYLHSRLHYVCSIVPAAVVSVSRLVYCAAECGGGAHEKRLLRDLFGDERQYNKLERPVEKESEALTVRFGLVLQQIIDVVGYR